MNTLPFIAHFLIGFFFIYFGFSNFLQRTTIIDVMSEKGIPLASLVFYLGIITETLCGVLIIVNTMVLFAAIILIVFDIVAVLLFHQFWQYDGELRRLNLIIFITNLTVVLGSLIILIDPVQLLLIIGSPS